MKELNYNIVVKSKRHLGQKVALVFIDKKRIKVHNGIMGHFTKDGIKLMIDGLLSETIPFFENNTEKILCIYDKHNFDIMKDNLVEPLSFKFIDEHLRKNLILKLKQYFNKDVIVVFKKKEQFYLRSGILSDMGVKGLKLKTSYYNNVRCEYNSIFNIFDLNFKDIIAI